MAFGLFLKSNMEDPIVTVERAVKRRDKGLALGPLDLALRAGEVLAVVGPPASGKTTLLRMLWGFIRPDEGRVSVMGKTPHLQQLDLRRNAGYVPRSFSFGKGVTAAGLLGFVSNFYPAWSWERAEALLRSLGIDASQKLEDLSRTDLRRLGIVSAITHRPDLLILDEPAAELDPEARSEVLGGVRRFATDEDAGIVLSSNAADGLQGVADSVVILNSGGRPGTEYPILRQAGANDCGPTCLAMISAYFGRIHSVAALSGLAGTNRDGTSLAGLIRAASGIGFASRGIRVSADAIHRVPLPVIAHWNEAGRNHYVVIYRTSAGKMTIGDPAAGLREIACSEFRKCWTGVLLLVAPEPDRWR